MDATASPWKRLYGLTWLVVLGFLLGLTPRAGMVVSWLHAAVGIGILVLAVWNYQTVKGTAVPGRVKRTSRATAQLATVTAVLGALLIVDVGRAWTLVFGYTVWHGMLFLHTFLAIGILAQCAAVGIAYDMWEENEFLQDTTPGDVPNP